MVALKKGRVRKDFVKEDTLSRVLVKEYVLIRTESGRSQRAILGRLKTFLRSRGRATAVPGLSGW